MEGADCIFTFAPCKEVTELIRSRNICCSFALGISCDLKGYPRMHGHIMSEYYAAIGMK